MSDLRIDSTKIQFHPHRVAQWRDAGSDWEKAKKVYPLYVEISPSGACSHRCTFCAVDYLGYKSILLDGPLLRERLREMAHLGVRSVMFAGEGEPLLHKQTNANVIAAHAATLDVAFTTNGVLLDRLECVDLCSWIKVSVNAGTRETYAKVHRTKEADWDRVWENIAAALKRKGECKIGVQMVVLPENMDECPSLYSRCVAEGVDYLVFKPYSQHKSSITREYEHFRAGNVWTPQPGPMPVYWRDDAPSHEPHQYTRCNATPNFWAYLSANGDLYSCSAYLLDERFRLGNLNESTFAQVWEGERRRENWRFVREELDIGECRKNCRMDKANRYLAAFDTLEHANFI